MIKTRIPLLSSAWLLLLTATCFGRQQENAASHPDLGELVRKAVHNEIHSGESGRFMFRSTKTTPKGSITKLYVESQEGTAGLVVAYNGKPLTPEQRRTERARVERFLKNPAELRKKRTQEQEDEDRTLRIVGAIPDAFLFEYAGQETGSDGVGRVGEPLVKLKFRPNPRYKPPSRVEQVLTGMQGFLRVDAARYRIASIDGTLFRDVNFGWGILGHLDRGGHFLVQQKEIGDHRWDISRIALDFTGKALLVKNLTIRSTEVFSGFKKVPPDLTFAQALELLEKEETATAVENSTTSKLALK
jgi:hypothetical protein